MRFRVQLSDFAGPVDLLWYLVRKQELDPLNIPVASIAEQYLEMVATLERIDADAAGDFLDVATRLMEAKSRQLAPQEDEAQPEENVEDPNDDLVRRLLEFKQYKDAAGLLEERGRQWRLRHKRLVSDLPPPDDSGEPPLAKVEVWDLVKAFSEVMQRYADSRRPDIRYDDTPIEVHMQRLRDRLAETPRLRLADLFAGAEHRSQLVGMFLALLELVRHHHVAAEQNELFGDIWITAAAQQQSALSS